MYGLGWGVWDTFFPKLAITIDSVGFFACTGQVSDIPVTHPTPITRCAFGGG